MIPADFESLEKLCPVGKIVTEEDYNYVMNIYEQIAMISLKSEDQKRYFSKMTNCIMEYEDNVCDL